MKNFFVAAFLILSLSACSLDTFTDETSSDAVSPFPPHALRLVTADDAADDAGDDADFDPDSETEAETEADACSEGTTTTEPYCPSGPACATAAILDCNHEDANSCATLSGLYVECFTRFDCADGRDCVVMGENEGACPNIGLGASVTCQPPSALDGGTHSSCIADVDCQPFGGMCVLHEIVGIPSLAGKAIGVCE